MARPLGHFLAEAVDLLDRVGHVVLAREYLDRVKAEPKDAAHLVAVAEAALEARHGEPRLAEELSLGLSQRRIDPRGYWRVTLLRGFAALGRGADDVAAALAAQAFEGVARLGQHKLPLIRERVVTEQLLALAASTGQPDQLDLCGREAVHRGDLDGLRRTAFAELGLDPPHPLVVLEHSIVA